jgi:hypothetical protein
VTGGALPDPVASSWTVDPPLGGVVFDGDPGLPVGVFWPVAGVLVPVGDTAVAVGVFALLGVTAPLDLVLARGLPVPA